MNMDDLLGAESPSATVPFDPPQRPTGSYDMQQAPVTKDLSAGESFNSMPAVPSISTSFSAPISNLTPPKEMSKLRRWEHQHELELDVKSKREAEGKQVMRQQAADDLQRWYDEKKQRHTTRKSTNRSDEQVTVARRDAANQPSANPWERVASLLGPAANVEPIAGSNVKRTDVSRMKQVLIQLKSTPLPVA